MSKFIEILDADSFPFMVVILLLMLLGTLVYLSKLSEDEKEIRFKQIQVDSIQKVIELEKIRRN